jgi:hypothetical protein
MQCCLALRKELPSRTEERSNPEEDPTQQIIITWKEPSYGTVIFGMVLNQSSSPQSLETLTYNGAAAKSLFGYMRQTIWYLIKYQKNNT